MSIAIAHTCMEMVAIIAKWLLNCDSIPYTIPYTIPQLLTFDKDLRIKLLRLSKNPQNWNSLNFLAIQNLYCM